MTSELEELEAQFAGEAGEPANPRKRAKRNSKSLEDRIAEQAQKLEALKLRAQEKAEREKAQNDPLARAIVRAKVGARGLQNYVPDATELVAACDAFIDAIDAWETACEG